MSRLYQLTNRLPNLQLQQLLHLLVGLLGVELPNRVDAPGA